MVMRLSSPLRRRLSSAQRSTIAILVAGTCDVAGVHTADGRHAANSPRAVDGTRTTDDTLAAVGVRECAVDDYRCPPWGGVLMATMTS
jgi:hypothetical protein